MTEIYEYYSWPKEVDIVCPVCNKQCVFSIKNQIVNKSYRNGQSAMSLYTNRWAGRISCLSCGLVQDSEITWPNDAYFKVDVRGHILWAWSKNHAVEIRDYLNSKIRINRGPAYFASLCKIPTHFKRRGNRHAAVCGLGKLIRNASKSE